MTDNTFRKLPLKKAYPFGRSQGLQREIEEIIAMEIRWPPELASSVRRGYVVQLVEARGLMDAFIRLHWPSGYTREGEWHRNYVVRLKERFEAAGEA